MRTNRALSITIATLAIFAAGGGVFAQETVPETPPELRGFRLDPERALPQPQPTIQPTVVTPPVAVPTLPEPAPTTRRPASRPQPTLSRPVQSDAAEPAPQSAPTVSPSVDPIPEEVQPQPIEEPAGAPLVQDNGDETSVAAETWWAIAIGLGFGAIILLGFAFWKRRQPSEEAPFLEPVAEVDDVETVPEMAISLTAAPPAVPTLAEKPLVKLGFIPERATVSVTTLTIKGQLQLVNEGGAPAKDMQLRAGLVSASAVQEQIIKAFHQDAVNISAERLGEAQPGERIGMAIELSVPLTDLQSFALGEQRLLVPIMVANLSYSGSGTAGDERAFIACMIGREAHPPQPKMAPLRLDLGPRSFAPLGQRPVLR